VPNLPSHFALRFWSKIWSAILYKTRGFSMIFFEINRVDGAARED
jgi:hypothetical protein